MAHREGVVSLLGSPWRNLQVPEGCREAKIDDREVDYRWEGMEVCQTHTAACKSPSGHIGCQLTPQHTHSWAEDGHPHINTFSGDATPGKTEVSFDQWYHEVWCIKDHYPEVVV